MEKKQVRIVRLSWILAIVTRIWGFRAYAYRVIPIAKKHDKLLPVIELQRAFFAMTPASFVPVSLLIDFEFLCSAGSFAFTAKHLIRCDSLRIHS